MQAEKITLNLHRKNRIKKVKIRPTQKLKKVIDFYSNETLIPPERLHFIYNGHELSANDTPEAMNMSNADQIEVKIDKMIASGDRTEPIFQPSNNQTEMTESMLLMETSDLSSATILNEQMEQQPRNFDSEKSIEAMEHSGKSDDAIASTSTEKRKNENEDSGPAKVHKTYPMSQTERNLALIAKYENVNWADCFQDILNADSCSFLLKNDDYQRKLEMENEELKKEIETLKRNHEMEVQHLKESHAVSSAIHLDEVKTRTNTIINNLQERCETYENDKKELEREIERLKVALKEGDDNFIELKIENNQLTSQLQAAIYNPIPNHSKEIEKYKQNIKAYLSEIMRLTKIVNDQQRKEEELTQCRQEIQSLRQELQKIEINHMESSKVQSQQTAIINRMRSEHEGCKLHINNFEVENYQLKTELGSIKSQRCLDKKNMDVMVANARKQIMDHFKCEPVTSDSPDQSNTDLSIAEINVKERKCVLCEKMQPLQKLTFTYCSTNCKLSYFREQYEKGH